jgi:hypothetical protein
LLTACASPIPTGTALTADGASANGALSTHATVGRTYRFSFPLFHNASGENVSIESVSMAKVPTGVKITGYPVYAMSDTDGQVLGALDGDPGSTNMLKMPNYAGRLFIIPPRATSQRYAMAVITVVGQIKGVFDGCRVNYKTGGQEYTQILACGFNLTTN